MIVRPKDSVKLIGILIMCFCASWVCTMFLNSNIDIARIKDQISSPQLMEYYDAIVAGASATSAITGGALAATTVVMLIFYVKHYIDTHRTELGILKALGYSNIKIAKGFAVFGFSVLVGTSLGFVAAWIMMPSYYAQTDREGFLPEITIHFNPELLVEMIIIPTICFALLAILYAYFKLHQPALELVRGTTNIKRRAKSLKVSDKDLPFLLELKRSTLRSKKSLVFFIGFSALMYSSMTQMSVSMGEFSSEMMGYMILGIGLSLAFVTLFIALTTVIKGNTKTIAMLRVFGYTDQECSRAILNSYRPVAFIGFVIGTAYQFILLKLMMNVYFAQTILEAPEYNFDVIACIISFITFIVVYEAVMKMYSMRLKRIQLKEVMLGE